VKLLSALIVGITVFCVIFLTDVPPVAAALLVPVIVIGTGLLLFAIKVLWEER
jgi:hypothetical protein